MADFRRVRRLLAYSGGTVPGFHRIHYSPFIPFEMSGTQVVYEVNLIINPIGFTVKPTSCGFSLFFILSCPVYNNTDCTICM